ncbi:MAG: PH domain-containing protein [Solirubrobacteraceae bacterium]
MTSHDSNRRVYYSRARAAGYLLATAFVVFVAVAAATGAKGTGGQVGAIVAGCAVAALLLRWAACAVIADADGLTVRNPLRTYRIAYDQIANISTVGYTGTLMVAGNGGIVAIERKDGRTVRASALITYLASGRRRARRPGNPVISELLARTQHASPGILDPPAGLP